jgi:hypothetical protein
MNMKIQYYNKIRWGLAPLAPNEAPPLSSAPCFETTSVPPLMYTHFSFFVRPYSPFLGPWPLFELS